MAIAGCYLQHPEANLGKAFQHGALEIAERRGPDALYLHSICSEPVRTRGLLTGICPVSGGVGGGGGSRDIPASCSGGQRQEQEVISTERDA